MPEFSRSTATPASPVCRIAHKLHEGRTRLCFLIRSYDHGCNHTQRCADLQSLVKALVSTRLRLQKPSGNRLTFHRRRSYARQSTPRRGLDYGAKFIICHEHTTPSISERKGPSFTIRNCRTKVKTKGHEVCYGLLDTPSRPLELAGTLGIRRPRNRVAGNSPTITHEGWSERLPLTGASIKCRIKVIDGRSRATTL